MQADELNDGLALFAVKLQAGQQRVGQLDAGSDVVLVAAGLAGIMQQQGEQEEIEAVDLRQQLGKPLLVFVRGLAQAVDIVDGQEGMLIDGVAMIAVANDQGVNAVELRDQHLQNAEGMHGAQAHARRGVQAALRARHSTDKGLRGYEWPARAARR